MPSVGRKFLMAGRGGLNLTHSEPAGPFLARYGDRAAQVAPWLARMDAAALRDWAHGLGVRTFVGTSGRVFPEEMKAAPLLRAWLARLRAAGLRFHMRHRWLGWPRMRRAAPRICVSIRPRASVAPRPMPSCWPWAAAAGPASVRMAPGRRACDARGVAVAPLRPANCGFDVDWSEHFRERYAGQPVKPVSMRCGDDAKARQGEFVVTRSGIEGSLVYALSAALRDRLQADGRATAVLDLLPDWPQEK